MGLCVDVPHLAVEALEDPGTLPREPAGTESSAPLTVPDLCVYVASPVHLVDPLCPLLVEALVGGDHLFSGLIPSVLLLGGSGEGGDYVPVPQLVEAHELRLEAEVTAIGTDARFHCPHKCLDCFLLDIVVDEALCHRCRILPPLAHLKVVAADAPYCAGP